MNDDDFKARDIFAGLAMCGMLANPIMEDATNEDIAFGSYKLADAMIKAREPKEQGIASIKNRGR